MGALRLRARRLWNRLLPGVPVLIRIKPGLWWVARNDTLSNYLFAGYYDRAEYAFLQRYLQPGMTVVDIGANAGLYAMVAARCVGASGRVIAFEPSSRERAQMATHLRLNRMANVVIEPFAVGDANGSVELRVVEAVETGCNSLRPASGLATHGVQVPMCRLDDYISQRQVRRVDLIKLDIEGGERDALFGAAKTLEAHRPVLLCEIEPARILPWGYAPTDIVDFVRGLGYEWFALDGPDLIPLRPDAAFRGNYIARPQ